MLFDDLPCNYKCVQCHGQVRRKESMKGKLDGFKAMIDLPLSGDIMVKEKRSGFALLIKLYSKTKHLKGLLLILKTLSQHLLPK